MEPVPLLPPGGDFVTKARHTIFYSALDAYVHHFDASIPRDGVAHIRAGLAKASLDMMERNMGAEITSCADVELSAAA